ncbi:MAG: glycosyl hydrolase [Planctomycetota bacterium]|jgi:hypothetical protein
MKRMLSVITFLAAFPSGVLSAAPQSILESGFCSPPHPARPYVYWQWMDKAITKEGITKDLEAMTEQGIAGAAIFNVWWT